MKSNVGWHVPYCPCLCLSLFNIVAYLSMVSDIMAGFTFHFEPRKKEFRA